MRDFFLLLLIFWVTTLFLPWWALVVPAILLGAVLFKSGLRALIIGFLSGAAAWGLQVLYIDFANQSVLSIRIADMLGVGSHWNIILITLLIGGLITALSVLLGAQIRLILKPRRDVTSFS